MSDEQAATVQVLKTLAPLDGMKRENLNALAKKVSVKTLAALVAPSSSRATRTILRENQLRNPGKVWIECFRMGKHETPGTETLGFNMKRLDPITIVDGDLRERAGARNPILSDTEP